SNAPAAAEEEPPGEDPPAPGPTVRVSFHDEPLRVGIGTTGMKPAQGGTVPSQTPATWEPSMRFGLVMVDETAGGREKRLTFRPTGITNNTCVKLDGNEWLFGEKQ